ncbi:MAG TPA: CHRD domain-containing protein [Daejeonella sp.]|nr:CHRD domain-containing protein [Daejeonella sp.]
MKNSNKIFLMCLFVVTSILGCKDDNNPKVKDTLYNYDVTLSGANEVPPNTSSATGKFVGTYTKSTKVLSFTLSYTGMTATDWHIHKGAPTVSGAVVIGLNPVVPSPLVKSVTLTAEQETDLLSGNYYVNIHSATFPGGEIRAQLGSPVVVDKEGGDGGY